MRMVLSRALTACALLIGVVSAQTPQAVGFNFNCTPNAVTRGAVAGNEIQMGQRFDRERYLGWGRTDPTNPASPRHLIDGLRYYLQDQDASTIENYDIFFYDEDPAQPDFPTQPVGQPAGTSATGSMLAVPSPGGAATPVAWIVTLTFTQPMTVPQDKDAFILFHFPAAPTWTLDGLTIQIILGWSAGTPFTIWDLQGPGVMPQGCSAIMHDVLNGPLSYRTQAYQHMIEPMTLGPTGVVTTTTNQATFTISATPPGTASFMSGLNPDATLTPANAGRADDVGYHFSDPTIGTAPVFFIAEFSLASVPLPLDAFVPGSSGIACLGFALQTVGIGISANGVADNVVAIPAAARGVIAGLTVGWGAIGLDPATNVLRGGACGLQQF